MNCISTCQERCLNLWTKNSDLEVYYNNDIYLSLSKEEEPSKTMTQLCAELGAWRNRVSKEVECLPGFVVSLDFLSYVAWKQPITDDGLRIISRQLPVFLEDHNMYRTSLCNLVMKITNTIIPKNTIYYYSRINVVENANHIKNKQDELAIKLFVAGSLVVGFGTCVWIAICDINAMGRNT